jgi:transcriptional regulator with XRE-family HTH domain
MRARLASELREARLAAGLSLDAVSRASGLSATQVRRIDRGDVTGVSLSNLCVLFATLGMRLSARPYPAGPPIRDAAHARLLARFKAQLPATIQMRTEVPLRAQGDLRAWDGELALDGEACKLEAETALRDLQAVDRRVARKLADDGAERVILLVADTHRNRRVLREFGDLVSARYRLDTRGVLLHLRTGRLPPTSGVCIL